MRVHVNENIPKLANFAETKVGWNRDGFCSEANDDNKQRIKNH